ncbi:Transformation/transcription domain-associated protein-like [Tropilaelaps mercedesae]|uniref:Transformation/transcription domain-associated protein-like n=1 Tax=Tropilaelaps mercedesae TaxID=418985 RepID=A0A1V9X9T8_9ACAR|nr:Transformation/transcription domain-associated protein-like [Tropilaelaps mercedesae]
MSAPSTPGTSTFSMSGAPSAGSGGIQSGSSGPGQPGGKNVIGATGTGMVSAAGTLLDPIAQMNTYKSYVSLLADPSAKDDSKQKAAQELSEDFETITASPAYPSFLQHSMPLFIRVLQEGEAQFIAEHSMQITRKLVLEIIHRLPTNEHLRPYVKPVLSVMFKLLEVENEDNVLVCLRVIIELHKQYRPPFNPEIQNFLSFVKNIYRELPNQLEKIFEPREDSIKVKDISEVSMDTLLNETFTTTVVQVGTGDAAPVAAVNIIPKAVLSLKVLAELPIIVVLMYQLYKPNVHRDVAEFIPLILNTIVLQPSRAQQAHKDFNREVFVDFMAAQIKTLSFLAYIVKLYQDVVNANAGQLADGMLGLLVLCPPEVAHLRKELLIAARHILATDLRTKFVGCIDKLFDEDILLGNGWTANESLRPLAYSTLADLVHHVRQSLPLKHLSAAVSVFSKNVHDETLPISMQTMSCKLLLNLVDCIRSKSQMAEADGQAAAGNGGASSQDSNNVVAGRELLTRMLQVFVLKFRTISRVQLPALVRASKHYNNAEELNRAAAAGAAQGGSKLDAQTGTSGSAGSTASSAAAALIGSAGPAALTAPCGAASSSNITSGISTAATVAAGAAVSSTVAELKSNNGMPQYTVVDCRTLIKTLVCGVKTITWGICTCKSTTGSGGAGGGTGSDDKQFQPKETLIFIRLIKYSLLTLDIYTLPLPVSTAQLSAHSIQAAGGSAVAQAARAAQIAAAAAAAQPQKTKDEKEVLDHLGGVFTMMTPGMFRAVFTTTIDYVVERLNKNPLLQTVANYFLANKTTSSIFATILVEYLLERMDEMGSNMDKSSLYLKLFKLVFGSVSLFPQENEQMLKPHLHKIVNRSMQLALSAKEPYNYFLLLRALFRSIGGGSHDLLYQEFLPLLPTLLQGLNQLQSGLHKQHMKDLFVELCLTVPVRLSSLLPYLPMLMDPLVSALNGSQTLISQGLRTLELCVDNLQPDFLYEHIQPVRAELMQALWKTLRNPQDNIAQIAFRVLGKFGGGNRKMLVEPQTLKFNEFTTDGPAILVMFIEHKMPVWLPMNRLIETAFDALKLSTTDPFYRQRCWDLIKGYLLSHMQPLDGNVSVQTLFSDPAFSTGPVAPYNLGHYTCQHPLHLSTHKMALTAMFVAAAIKELRGEVLPFFVSVVNHYTMVAVSQQAGPFMAAYKQSLHSNKLSQTNMDPLVLIDALVQIMGHEEKELCKVGQLASVLIIEAASTVLTSRERAATLPFIEYLSEKMCSLCYERAWYAKSGGCFGIKGLMDRLPLRWVLQHQYQFLKALLFVMMDLTNEVSNGAVDMARTTLGKLLQLCATTLPEDTAEDMIEVQKKSLNDVTMELVRQVTSPNTCVRQQAMSSLQMLSEVTKRTITDIMLPHKDLLQDMVPPKKHILKHQPVNAQIGIMEGNTFCTTLQPRLFTLDLNQNEHKIFFQELLYLCDSEDQTIMKIACYKNSQGQLGALRKAALNCLATLHYIDNEQNREKVFTVLYKVLNSSDPDLQEAAFHGMKKFISGNGIKTETVHKHIRGLLIHLGDYRHLNLNVIQRLSYLTLLFPNTFNEKLCEQLRQLLRRWFEVCIQNKSIGRSFNTELKQCTAIIEIFHQIPAASAALVEPLVSTILSHEKLLVIEAASPLHEPLAKFLRIHPEKTVEVLLQDAAVQNAQHNRYLEFLLKGDKGHKFRQVLIDKPNLVGRLLAVNLPPDGRNVIITSFPAFDMNSIPQITVQNAKHDFEYLGVRVIGLLIKHEEKTDFLIKNPMVVAMLREIWISSEFQTRHTQSCVEISDFVHWRTPKLVVKALLNYCKQNPNDVELLFQLLRAFTSRYIPDFKFLKDFIDHTVATQYSVEWKRNAFFKFVKLFEEETNFPQELVAKVLQRIIIPAFTNSFEKGEGTELIGGEPAPDQDLDDNVISVFILKIIDNPKVTLDSVRILVLQLSCLFVDQAAAHIHDAANKRQGIKLRRLMTYAWPCLLTKSSVDPASKYHGHLLLAHIIAKFAIHKKIVLQVFHSLLKAHAVEARGVVRQALEILTPAMPARMDDGNTMLTHWTKKMIVEEGHTLAQLVHMLQLLYRHHLLYYPVRHHLVAHMVSSVQRLGFTANAQMEHKKLSVDLAEVIIKWEMQRNREEQQLLQEQQLMANPTGGEIAVATVVANNPNLKPIDKVHTDSIVNFLLRMACQVNDSAVAAAAASTAGAGGSGASLGSANPAGDVLSRRCVALLKNALKPELWPNAELKLVWFDKLLLTVEAAPEPNFQNICTALDLLTFLLTILRKEAILNSFKNLQRGVAACMTSSNSKVLRSVHSLLSRLMSTFPAEPNTPKYEELDHLYAQVFKVVSDGLSNYEKQVVANPPQLFGTLMILKAACVNNPCYIDRLITPFMRVLQKMTREHLAPTTEASPMGTELLILSLDLVKNRVGVMGQEMRKVFLGSVLVGLIEKSHESKVLKAITKMVEDWVRNKSPLAINQSPSLREKSILLVKMMQYIEKRFPDDLELNGQFLELVNYVYRDESFKNSELPSKLEPAFMAGLRCVQPAIRAKFFEVFDASIKKRLYDRLMYIICSQNWETIGPHFWIKQCIELVLVTAAMEANVEAAPGSPLLPAVTSVVAQADHNIKAAFTFAKEEPMDVDGLGVASDVGGGSATPTRGGASGLRQNISQLVMRQKKFLEQAGRNVALEPMLLAVAQLCHMDTALAQHMWVQLFPRLWKILGEKQQNVLSVELTPFICSGSHVIQKDCHPNAIGTFCEALSHCPNVQLRPMVTKYMGKSHNMWHRATLQLEQIAATGEKALKKSIFTPLSTAPSLPAVQPPPPPPAAANSVVSNSDTPATPGMDGAAVQNLQPPQVSLQHEGLDCLSEMYSLLREEDLFAGLWQKRAKYQETITAATYEQHGMFEQAQLAYEAAMAKGRNEFATSSAPLTVQSEFRLWEEHWIRCTKELNQWEVLLEYGNSKPAQNMHLVLEAAWRVPNWVLMKEALSHVEVSCPKELAWKVNLYRGYNAICHPEETHLSLIDRLAIVSHFEGVQAAAGGACGDNNPTQTNSAMIGVHASASTIIHYGKVARKHGLNGVCLDSLNKIHTIPSVPILDCFQKIRQQVKCYLHMSGVGTSGMPAPVSSSTNSSGGKNELQEGLDVIESTNLKYFGKEMTAEFYALKGMFLAQLGRSSEANKAFSAAIQMYDGLNKGWALWGDYLEALFTKDAFGDRNMQLGEFAVTCYLHAARTQNEAKARKYLAKLIWLLTFDSEKFQLSECVDQYFNGVPPQLWLPWVPQLLTCLVRQEGKQLLNLLTTVGRVFPQAVYFPIRTLYLTLKVEQRERYRSSEADRPRQLAQVVGGNNGPQVVGAGGAQTATNGQPQVAVAQGTAGNQFRATPSMWRCSKIMHIQRDLHPTLLSSIEGIVDQLVWFRENWYEEVLRQLKQALAKCLAVAFEHRMQVNEATVTPHTLNFVKKLVSTFGVGIESVVGGGGGGGGVTSNYSTSASESLARRVQATSQDPVFQKMKVQFTADFDFSTAQAMKLHNLIGKLKKWIKILEAKAKLLPKSTLVEEKCRFMSNFSPHTAEVALPGEFLLPKANNYYVRIARFMPRVEIVHKHNTAARRLSIRGQNGKLYPYLVVNDACLSDARREERVLQLLRMLNQLLARQKETARRGLNFTVPRVVAVSPQMRLVEDNPCSLSLVDIYKQRCVARTIEYDTPISKYYEKLASVQARGGSCGHQVLKDILRDIQTSQVPRTLLKEWAQATYPDPTDYWTFRKQFTLQLALCGLVEFVLQLTRLSPDMVYIHQDSGFVHAAYYKFDVADATGELDHNRPVPFRLTPNMAELVGAVGVQGPMCAAVVAVARCLSQPSFTALLRAILRDEIITWHKKNYEEASAGGEGPPDMDGEQLVATVSKAVAAITSRLNSLTSYESSENSKVQALLTAASNPENLCRMDPAWHPWL